MTQDHPHPPDPTSPAQLRALFRRYGFRPRRSLGQTFLIDANIVAKIIAAARLDEAAPVLEIGAGAGAVTCTLARAAPRVVAVEIDPVLVAILSEILPEGVQVLQDDLLALDWRQVLGPPREGRWRVVANLPYAIMGPAILRLLEASEWVERFIIMAQEEVADRLVALPGGRARGALSVFAQAVGDPEVVWRVPRTCFYPQPNVDSALVGIPVRRPPLVPACLQGAFRDAVRGAFGTRRKMLVNALSHSRPLALAKQGACDVLAEADIEPGRRAESLSAEEFLRLARALARRRGEAVA